MVVELQSCSRCNSKRVQFRRVSCALASDLSGEERSVWELDLTKPRAKLHCLLETAHQGQLRDFSDVGQCCCSVGYTVTLSADDEALPEGGHSTVDAESFTLLHFDLYFTFVQYIVHPILVLRKSFCFPYIYETPGIFLRSVLSKKISAIC